MLTVRAVGVAPRIDSRTAEPGAVTIAFAGSPSAASVAAKRLPPSSAMPPENVLTPPRWRAPAPLFTRPDVPAIAESSVVLRVEPATQVVAATPPTVDGRPVR